MSCASIRLLSPLQLELRWLLRASLPLMMTLVAQVGMGVVDALFLGRLPAAEIGGAAIAIQGYAFASMSMNGILSAISVSWCRAKASGSPARKQEVLWATYALIAVCLVLTWSFFLLLPRFFPYGELAQAAQSYLRPLAYAAPAHLLCLAARFLLAAEHAVRGLTRIYLLGLLVNMVGNSLLVPQFGLAGIAWNKSVVYWLMALSIVIWLPWPRLRPKRAWKELGQLLRFGLPVGAAVAADAGMIATVTFFFCNCGTHALAAHHFMLQWTYVGFMFPCALAMVLAIRVGRYHELGRSLASTQLLRTALLLVSVVTLALGLVAALALPWLLPAIVPGEEAGPQAIRATCITLIPVVLTFQISNALQGTLLGFLRGLKQTTKPLACVACAYWAVGVPMAYALAGCGPRGAAGVWAGLVAGQCALVLMLLQHIRAAGLSSKALS